MFSAVANSTGRNWDFQPQLGMGHTSWIGSAISGMLEKDCSLSESRDASLELKNVDEMVKGDGA